MKTKEKILYATLDLASEKGLGRVSMNDIAVAVGIRKPSLYSHYKSKEELIDTMFYTIKTKAKEDVMEDNIDAYIDRFPAEAILYHAIDVYMKWNQKEDMKRLNKVIISEKMVNEQIKEMAEMETEEQIMYFTSLFAKMKQHGKISITNVNFASKLLVYHMEKLIEYACLDYDNLEKEVHDLCHNFSLIFEKGDF